MIDLTKLMDTFLEQNPGDIAAIQAAIIEFQTESRNGDAYEPSGIEAARKEIEETSDPDRVALLVTRFHDNLEIMNNLLHPVRLIHQNSKRQKMLAVFGLFEPLIAKGRKFSDETRSATLKAEAVLAKDFGAAAFKTPLHQHIDQFDAALTQWEQSIKQRSKWNFLPMIPHFHYAFWPPAVGNDPDISSLSSAELASTDVTLRRAALDVKAQRQDEEYARQRAASLSQRQAATAYRQRTGNRLRTDDTQDQPGVGQEEVNTATT